MDLLAQYKAKKSNVACYQAAAVTVLSPLAGW